MEQALLGFGRAVRLVLLIVLALLFLIPFYLLVRNVGFPAELEDAAKVDGLGYWRTYWRIVVPDSRPVFAAVSTIVFIGAWNSFLWPLVIGQDKSTWTVQVSLSTFITAQVVNIHELFVAAAVSILPLLLVFLLLQRHIVAGIERSAIED